MTNSGNDLRSSGQVSCDQRSPGQRSPGQRNPGQRNPGQRNPGQRSPGQRREGGPERSVLRACARVWGWLPGLWLTIACSAGSDELMGEASPPGVSGSTHAGASGGGQASNAGGPSADGGAVNSNTLPTNAPDSVLTETGKAVDCTTLVRPPTPLRRLTRFEYDNAVRDLLGASLRPSSNFPVDEIADGFSNNALVLTVSSLHVERYVEASELLAADAVTRLDELLPCETESLGETECAQRFAEEFGRRAFRRALTSDDLDMLMAAYAAGGSYSTGIELMIRTMLQSPHFLYRVEYTGLERPGSGMVRLDPYETAARLSFLLWASGPDDVLLDAAQNGELASAEEVAVQARRLLADERAHSAVAEFYRQWTELNTLKDDKDKSLFPLWSSELRQSMLDEAEAVIAELLWKRGASLAELLTAPLGQPSAPLAELYGVPAGAGVVDLEPTERLGFLTLPGFLAAQSHPDQTSPVSRGKFIRSKLLCTPPSPPPDNVMFQAPDVAEGGTARERFSRHATDESCAGCHALMDPLGYPLEGYDAIGRFRTTDNGAALDLSGQFVATRDLDGSFVGPREMVQRLAESDQVRDCVVTQWYKYVVGRGVELGDACSLAPLQEAFAESGGDLMEMMVRTTQTEAFLYRRSVSAEGL